MGHDVVRVAALSPKVQNRAESWPAVMERVRVLPQIKRV
jgi:hypothetical protein